MLDQGRGSKFVFFEIIPTKNDFFSDTQIKRALGKEERQRQGRVHPHKKTVLKK